MVRVRVRVRVTARCSTCATPSASREMQPEVARGASSTWEG